MYGNDNFSQADVRSYRVFRDQHGRKWGADVENKTQAPCGPLALLIQAPVVCTPPLIPEQKYITLVDRAAGDIRIEYEQWLEDERRAHEDHARFVFQHATDLYKDQAAQAVEDMPPALRFRVGTGPLPIERIEAAAEGNPWVLGFDTERPSWADKFFPLPVAAPTARRFLSAAEEREERAPAPSNAAPVDSAPASFPRHVGFGAYMLSDGTETPRGTGRDKSEELEAALHEHDDEQQPVGAGAGVVDPSWNGG